MSHSSSSSSSSGSSRYESNSSERVDSADVIKVVMQFLQDHGLHGSLRALQTESQVPFNIVKDPASLREHIIQGKWELVMAETNQMRLYETTQMELYELVCWDLLEEKEFGLLQGILEHSEVMRVMQDSQPERFKRLEIAKRTGSVLDGVSKQQRRAQLAEAIVRSAVVPAVPPARLLTLLGQAVKWNEYSGEISPGEPFDIVYGGASFKQLQQQQQQSSSSSSSSSSAPIHEKDVVISSNFKKIKFANESFPEVAVFSPDGAFLVTGSSDGFLEVWIPTTGKLNKELKFQAENKLMMHGDPQREICCLAFSHTSDMIASGDVQGTIKIFRVLTGSCLATASRAHASAVTCAAFSRDGSQVLSGGSDNLAYITGLRSMRAIKEFRGHTDAVTCVKWLRRDTLAVTGSRDGTIKLWEVCTQSCLATHPAQLYEKPDPVVAVLDTPGSSELITVVSQSGHIEVLDAMGAVQCEFERVTGNPRVVGACYSAKGQILYMASEAKLWHFDVSNRAAIGVIGLHKADMTGLTHHPTRNILASFAKDKTVKLWK